MISEYKIFLNKKGDNAPIDIENYEEISVGAFLDREAISEEEKNSFINRYFGVNIHAMIANSTLPWALETVEDIQNDKRLENLNAIVFLSLKQKGRGKDFTPVSQEDFTALIRKAQAAKISYGLDSCGSHSLIEIIKNDSNRDYIEKLIEPCESTLFSAYIDVNAQFFPCSFAENTEVFGQGIDVENCNNFVDDVWNHPRTIKFRENLLKLKRHCPIYKIR